MEWTGETLLVGKKEPSMLHLHILGRGDPKTEYIPGIPLDAPAIGEEFNLKGQGKINDNTKKLPWSIDQLNIISSKLKTFIHSNNTYKENISEVEF
jgi:hypothetical protein